MIDRIAFAAWNVNVPGHPVLRQVLVYCDGAGAAEDRHERCMLVNFEDNQRTFPGPRWQPFAADAQFQILGPADQPVSSANGHTQSWGVAPTAPGGPEYGYRERLVVGCRMCGRTYTVRRERLEQRLTEWVEKVDPVELGIWVAPSMLMN